jgi:hypothetical protein
MKLIRVPWICCRADEVDAIQCEMEWRGRIFAVMAYSEKEARQWWQGLRDSERSELLGAGSPEPDEGFSLF